MADSIQTRMRRAEASPVRAAGGRAGGGASPGGGAGRAGAGGRVRRRAMPAGRVLFVVLICFGAWMLLDARNLERSAAAGALGPRRTITLALLRPLRRFSEFISLDRPSVMIDEALGRNIHGPVGGSKLPAPAPVVPVSAPVPQPSPTSEASVPAAVTPAATTTTLSPALLPLRQPTAGNPLRVLVVGDSIAKDFGDSLINQFSGNGLVNFTVDARAATGLSRPDYFDWNGELAADLSRYRPDLLISMFGGNDAQSFLVNGHAVSFGSAEWDSTYASRVDRFVGQAVAAGSHVLWVGMPVMASPSFSANMQILNTIDRTEVAKVAGAGGEFFDCWSLFADSSGHYAAYLPDSGGQLQLMRKSDGIHFSIAGANRLATAVTAEIQRRFGIRLHT